MAQVVYSLEAMNDLQRFALFESETAETRAVEGILQSIEVLEHSPEIGRPVARGYRELVISRGRSGYLAVYRFDVKLDLVRVLRLRHQREAGYR